jgi:hypothetical protein
MPEGAARELACRARACVPRTSLRAAQLDPVPRASLRDHTFWNRSSKPVRFAVVTSSDCQPPTELVVA